MCKYFKWLRWFFSHNLDGYFVHQKSDLDYLKDQDLIVNYII